MAQVLRVTVDDEQVWPEQTAEDRLDQIEDALAALGA